jgi:phage replication initiation protein
LFSVIKASKGNITRLDLANDNIDGSLRLDLIQDSIDNHEVRTLFKRGKKVEEFTYHDESALNGKTIYLSRSRESLVYPRIYDKAAQHGLSGHWVRFEIELKGQRAMKAAQYLLDGVPVGELFFSIVNTYFAIINLDDSNKSRCSLKSWWSAWLESTNKIKLTVSKLIKKIDQVKLWFQKSVSPSLATIRKSFNNDGLFADYMKGILLDGRNRMSRKHEQILLNSKEMAINLPF